MNTKKLTIAELKEMYDTKGIPQEELDAMNEMNDALFNELSNEEKLEELNGHIWYRENEIEYLTGDYLENNNLTKDERIWLDELVRDFKIELKELAEEVVQINKEMGREIVIWSFEWLDLDEDSEKPVMSMAMAKVGDSEKYARLMIEGRIAEDCIENYEIIGLC